MSFIEGFLDLPQRLEEAWKQAAEEGTNAERPSKIIRNLAETLGDAIHEYMMTATVANVVTIEPGQTAAGPGGKGNYTAPGLGAGAGTVRFETSSVDDLKDEIEALLNLQMDEGTVTGCDPIEIIRNKSIRTTEAIHKFALTAIIETEVLLAGGVTVVGYLTPPGAPLPAVSLPNPSGLAKGLGNPAEVDGTGLS